jgi:PAS domain S-box-containing protein
MMEDETRGLLANADIARAALHSLGAIVVVLDGSFQVTDCNTACGAMMGAPARVWRGRQIWELFAPEDREAVRAIVMTPDQAGQLHEHDLHTGGRPRRISWAVHPISETGHWLLTGIDVTRCRRADAALAASEARFRAVIENAAEAILGVDPTGRIVVANPAAARMFGYEIDELVGAELPMLVPDWYRDRHADAQNQYFGNPADRRMGQRGDLAGRRKDGSEVPLEISLSHVRTAEGGMAIALLQDVTERRENRRRLQALARRLMTAQEEERRRIARDLHDDLTQTISLLGIKLGFLKQRVDLPRERLLEEIEDARRQVDGLVEEVRALSHRLHPSVLEYSGLEAALDSLAADVERHDGPAVRVVVDRTAAGIPAGAASVLYHIAQEALRNAAKHSEARTVDVRVECSADWLRMRIVDDGRGFEPDGIRGEAGLGLISMEERALGLGGRFAISTEPGRGTRIEVEVPLRKGPA